MGRVQQGTALVAAERAFARSADPDGMRPAFLAVLADSAVIFRPGPVFPDANFGVCDR